MDMYATIWPIVVQFTASFYAQKIINGYMYYGHVHCNTSPSMEYLVLYRYSRKHFPAMLFLGTLPNP